MNRIKALASVFLVFAYPFFVSHLIREGWSGAVLGAFGLLTAWRGLRAGQSSVRLACLLMATLLLAGAWLGGRLP